MKKLFMFLAVTGLATLGVSCGSDDGGGNNPEPQTGLVLSLVTNPADVIAGQGFELSIEDTNGNPVDGAVLVVDGEETTIFSEEGSFGVQAPAASYELSAIFEGIESNTITVVVNPGTPVQSEGEGSFTFNGQTYETENSVVVFRGIFYTDETRTAVISSWQIESYSGTRTAIVRFSTPAVEQAGSYAPTLPSATNVTPVVTALINGETVEGETNTGITVNFGSVLDESGLVFEGEYSSSATINANPFTITFDGASPLVDVSARPAAKSPVKGMTSAVVFGNSVKATNLSVISKEISKM